MRLVASCVFFMLLFGSVFTARLSADTPKTVGEILAFLEEVSGKFVLGGSKDIVLVLGNTGSGKSTVTLLITDAELEGRKVNEDDDDEEADYIVFDKNNLISNETTTVSQTLIPNLLIDSTNTSFYDCAGFDDSRGVAHDIAVTYLIRKLLNYANTVKFLFTIPQWSVKTGGERLEFKKLLKHATNLILSIDKFEESIALIVTKSDKPPNRNQANDEPKIKKVAAFLEQVKTDLDDSENPHIREQKLKFIDALLKKGSDGNHARIRMHRMVNEKGPLKNMPVQEQEKNAIKNMVYQAIQYQTVNSDDFGYAISSDSALKVVDLLDELQQQLLNDVSDIGNEIKKSFMQQEKQNTDINVIYDKIQQANQNLSPNSIAIDIGIDIGIIDNTGNTLNLKNEMISLTTSNNLTAFRHQIEQIINSLNMKELVKTQMKRLDTHLEFVNFLTSVGNKNLSSSFKISDGLLDTKRYFSDSEKWYGFLKNTHKEISAYSHQDKIKKYDKSSLLHKINKAIRDLGETDEMPCDKTGIQGFLSDFDLTAEKSQLENINVNSVKLKAFVALLNQLTIGDEVSCSGNKLTIKGYNIKLSDHVLNMKCQTKIIEIFALNKIFFDTSVEKRDQQMQVAIIAPTWEVTGSGVKLDLSGSSAENYYSSASSGYGDHDGESGQPGKPGGTSGHFFGVGDKFINDNNLGISTDGGRGGNGQNGGKGAEGENGATPPYSSGDFDCYRVWDRENFKYKSKASASGSRTTYTYQVNGKEGKKPTNGGNGGCGGLAGYSGKLSVVGLSQSPKVSLSSSQGSNGNMGQGAPGGAATSDGDNIEVENSYIMERSGIMRKWHSSQTGSSRGRRYQAYSGSTGANCHNRQDPPRQSAQRDPAEALGSFKSFLGVHLQNNVREMELKEFLQNLNTKL